MAPALIECSLSWCSEVFETYAEMRRHKINEPDHFYCKRCNVDCKDWEDLTQHKVEAMAPFIEGKMKAKAGELKHIVCEFCGEDFKSWGARKRHRRERHQADQDIECPGCQTNFVRASTFIAHLELGDCPYISKDHFAQQVIQKHMVSQIMKNPGRFMEKMESACDGSKPNNASALITDGSEKVDQDEGGVLLLHHSPRSVSSRKETEAWPRLPSQMLLELEDCESASSASSPAASAASGPTTGNRQSSRVLINHETFPPLGAAKPKPKPGKQPKPSNASRAVQPAFPLPDSQVLAEHAQAIAAVQSSSNPGAGSASNSLDLQFLNPFTFDFNVERFRNAQTGKYFCPFPDCIAESEHALHIGIHIAESHTEKTWECAYCRKRFKWAFALVAHAESPGKCKVEKTATFKKFLDEISGGFLNSKAVQPAQLCQRGTALVKHGEPINGVMSMKYSAETPNMW